MSKVFISRLSILFGFSCLLSVIFLDMDFVLMLPIVALGLLTLIAAGKRIKAKENLIEEAENADIAAARAKLDALYSTEPEEQEIAQILQFRPRSTQRFNT